MSDTDTPMVDINIAAQDDEQTALSPSETVDLVDSAMDHIVEAVTSEEHHEDNIALLIGALTATVEALTGRLSTVESRLSTAETVDEVIMDTVDRMVDSVEEIGENVQEAVNVEDNEEEPIVEADIPPPTPRSKLSTFWFGGSK